MPDFIPPNLWPFNSPDLNPVDYKVRGLLQERVYKTSTKDVDELRCRIAEEWDMLDQRIIDWRKRRQACVVAGGGQFEDKMWTFIISDILYQNFVTHSLKYCCCVLQKLFVLLSTMHVMCYIL